MKKYHILILGVTLIFSIYQQANAIDDNIKKKYSNVLLTDDYGVLTENDLASHTWEVKPPPFSDTTIDREDYNYWQCFPRENVKLILEDKGYIVEDIDPKLNCSEITISAWSNGITNVYSMRRYTDTDSAKMVFNKWQKLMRNEKYVCLAGRFGFEEDIIYGKNKHKEYSWIFEKIKTKKGCDSYFAGLCNLTYEKFLQEKQSSYHPPGENNQNVVEKKQGESSL